MPNVWRWPLESFSIAAVMLGKRICSEFQRLPWMLAQALVIERLDEAADPTR